MRLSDVQRDTLLLLKQQGQRPAYPGISMATLRSLQKRGLVKAYNGQLGAMAFPRNRILWSITDNGRAAIFTLAADDPEPTS
ncbi:hypothetical protein [Bradyrhizobium sp. USDA 4452]